MAGKKSERTMLEVEVYESKDGHICIKQPQYGMDDSIVAIHPSQVDLLIEWLQEIKAEISGNNN